MSYNLIFSVQFFSKPIYYSEMIRRWLNCGWTANNGVGGIQYNLSGEDDFPEIMSIPFNEKNIELVLDQCDEMESKNRQFHLYIMWLGTEYGAWVGFGGKDYPPDTIHFSYASWRRLLVAAPPLSDHNWYLERLLPPVLAAGCSVRSLEWKESP